MSEFTFRTTTTYRCDMCGFEAMWFYPIKLTHQDGRDHQINFCLWCVAEEMKRTRFTDYAPRRTFQEANIGQMREVEE